MVDERYQWCVGHTLVLNSWWTCRSRKLGGDCCKGTAKSWLIFPFFVSRLFTKKHEFSRGLREVLGWLGHVPVLELRGSCSSRKRSSKFDWYAREITFFSIHWGRWLRTGLSYLVYARNALLAVWIFGGGFWSAGQVSLRCVLFCFWDEFFYIYCCRQL